MTVNVTQWLRILQYFNKQACKACGEKITDGAIQKVKEVDNGVVVKVVCTHCREHVSTAAVTFIKPKRRRK